jgi:hypothetical protein
LFFTPSKFQMLWSAALAGVQGVAPPGLQNLHALFSTGARRTGSVRHAACLRQTHAVERFKRQASAFLMRNAGSALARRMMVDTEAYDRITVYASFDGEEHKEHRCVQRPGQ